MDDVGCDETDGSDDAPLLGIELTLSTDGGDELGAIDALELGAEERSESERELLDDWPLSLLLELFLDKPLDFVDEGLNGLSRSDPRLDLLRSELRGELFEDRPDDPCEREWLLESEDCELSDDSLKELDDRDDSLTLENDLLEP